MNLIESDHRVIRLDSKGNKWEYSDKDGQPSGDGWTRVDRAKHPRATRYLWVRPYSATRKNTTATSRPGTPLNAQKLELGTVKPTLLGSLDISVHNYLNDLRQKIRAGLKDQGPYYAGDRVRLKGDDKNYYVARVDKAGGKLYLNSAISKYDEKVVNYSDVEGDFEHKPSFWTNHDNVIISPDAVGGQGATKGEVIGFDDTTNKVRILVAGGKEVEVYPEAIVGLRGENAKALEKTDAYLDSNPHVLSDPDSRDIIESLLRASLQNRTSVSADEVWEDIKVATGKSIQKSTLKAKLASLETILGTDKHRGFIYNSFTDQAYIEDARLGLRLLANKRGVKSSRRLFGWKNITSNDSNEAYAYSGQDVTFNKPFIDSDNRPITQGKIKKIMGNKAQVIVGSTTRVMPIGELRSFSGKKLLPDPLDPAAYGAINRNAFWLLKDREWCKDFKKNDVVSLLSMVENPSGKQANYGEFGTVLDRTSDGRVTLKMNNGKILSVSPRQLHQVADLKNAEQFLQRTTFDPTRIYGSTSSIGEGKVKGRVSVGGRKDNKFLQFNFRNGKEYMELESKLLQPIYDNRATQQQTKAIIAANKDVIGFENASMQTLVPNKAMMEAIKKLYPNAKTFMIRREMRYLPNGRTTFNTPDTPERQQKYTADEREEKIKTTPQASNGNYIDPDTVNRATRKKTRGYRNYYEPEIAKDFETGELSIKGGSTEDVFSPLNKFSFLHPFGGDHVVHQTRTYSSAKIEGDYEHVPVSIKIIIDPKPSEIRAATNGIVHEIPYVLSQNSDWKDVTKRPPTAKFNGDINWDSRLKISIEGNRLYLTVGKDIKNLTSTEFLGGGGEPMSLERVLRLPQEAKYEMWSDRKNFKDLLEKTSLFTYDRATKRYTTSLVNYQKVHQFLKMFLGYNKYDAYTWEDHDGAFSTRASQKILAKTYEEDKKAREMNFAWRQKEDSEALANTGMDSIKKGFLKYRLEAPGREYQKDALNFVLSRDKSLLANDQGTGKTAIMLGAIVGRMNRGEVQRALVIAPASVAQNTWPEEINNWCKIDPKKAEKIEKSKTLTPVQKKEALAKLPLSVKPMTLNSRTKERFFKELMETKQPVIASCGYEMARLYGKELQQMGFQMVCLDEAQHIKTGKSKGVKGSKQTQIIKDVFSDVKYKIAGTGTPIENKAQDLHSIVDWLNPSILGSAEDFMNNFIVSDYLKVNGKNSLVNIAIKNAEELDNRLSEVMTRTSKTWMRKEEQNAIKEELAAKGIVFNPILHYGKVSPRSIFPIVKPRIDLKTGSVLYGDLKGNFSPFVRDLANHPSDGGNLLKPIDLSSSSNKRKYKSYIEAVNTIKSHVASQMKRIIQKNTRYGSVNTAATGAFLKMQKVLNDPILMQDDPELGSLPIFNDPNMPNPKYDRLRDILKLHDKLPLDPRTKGLVVDNITKQAKLRDRALSTRGKTIIFCNQTATMSALKKRLEQDDQFKGRIAVYAGTSKTAELSGKLGTGKKIRAESLRAIRNDNNTDILLANSAAETGLNIPQADLVLNYELPWNPKALDQRIDRAHRVGSQPRPVTAVNIFVANSVEEKKVRAHVVKRQLFDSIMARRETAQLIRRGLVLHKPEEEDENLKQEQLRKTAAYMGEDKARLMDEMMQKDPDMRKIAAATDADMQRSRMIKTLRQQAKRSKKSKASFRRKQNLIGRLFGW